MSEFLYQLVMSNASAYKAHIDAVKAQMPKIIKLRSETGLTFRQLAARFDVSENFIKTLFRELRSS